MKDGEPMSVDAYVNGIPPVKTAVLRLDNKDLSLKDLEVVGLVDKLRPILAEKGYVPASGKEKAAVVLRLFFGVRLNGSRATKYSFDSGDAPAIPYGENDTYTADMTTLYLRDKLYRKILKMTAEDRKGRQFWKITVEKEDETNDFRSSQGQLLYLFAKFVERDTGKRLTGTLSRSEFDQRDEKRMTAAESAGSYYAPAEKRNDYERRLQDKINAAADVFRACGVKNKTKFFFNVSAFGTLPAFDPSTAAGFKTLTTEQADCVAKAVEPMLEPPSGVRTPVSVLVSLPSE